MWRKHRSNFQDHVKYIHNEILKPFIVGIIQYADHIHEMHDIGKYLPPSSMKGQEYDEAYWAVRDKELFENDIHVATKYGLPLYM